MKTAIIIGVIFIVLGVISLALGGITYTSRKKVLDIGPVQASTEKQKRIPMPPVLGGISLVGGIVLVTLGSRRRK
jgi:hypothetical protein